MGALLLCTLAACGSRQEPAAKPAEPAQLPKITHFYANQQAVPKGDTLTLCYGTENVESVTLEGSSDPALRPSLNRCVSETPVKDTTYTLRVKGPGGETSESVSVRVGAPAQRQKTIIQGFDVLGNVPMRPGGRVQLCYTTVAGAQLVMTPPVASALEPGHLKCIDVSPAKTTTYVLTARTPDGGVDRMQVSVPVQ